MCGYNRDVREGEAVFYKTTIALTSDMLALPETGMGYQIIDAIKRDKHTRERFSERFVVYNSVLIVPYDSTFIESKRQLIKEGFNNILDKSDSLPLENVTLVYKSAIQEMRVLSESKKRYRKRYSGGSSAIDNPKEDADGKEHFVRLSAYQNDRRIDFENKKLRPGTYATTSRDYMDCVQLADDPIDRYALPNDATVKWAFYIQPRAKDTLQRGIVQPAFGQDGGGLEVYFVDGTSRDTYKVTRPYGE